MNKERAARTLPGIPTFFVLLAALIAIVAIGIWYAAAVLEPAASDIDALIVAPLVLLVLALIAVSVAFGGLTPVNPNEARALVLFGHYGGTVHTQGLQWVNPFTRTAPDLRARPQLRDVQAQGQ